MYVIAMKNCAFFARHGVHDEEETLGQRFYVDAVLSVDPGDALALVAKPMAAPTGLEDVVGVYGGEVCVGESGGKFGTYGTAPVAQQSVSAVSITPPGTATPGAEPTATNAALTALAAKINEIRTALVNLGILS